MEGASFEDILKYVLKHKRLTDSRARYLIMEVLKAGIAARRIRRTPYNTYCLAISRPAPVVHRIREPRFSDDSDDESSVD